MFVQMKKILSKLFNTIIGVSKDKLLHFICSLLITQIVIAVVSTIFNPSYGVAIIGLIVGIVADIIKEIYYNNNHERHSIQFSDFIANFIGALSGFVLMVIAIF